MQPSDKLDNVYFYLAPGIEAVPVGEEDILLRSEVVSLRLDGGSARFFAERVLPLLDGKISVNALSSHLNLAPDDLYEHLSQLADSGVLVSRDSVLEARQASLTNPFIDLLQTFNIPLEHVRDRLARLRVVIFGLGSSGAQIADLLVRSGVGTLVLVDPTTCLKEDFAVIPILSEAAPGETRAHVVGSALQAQSSLTQVIISGTSDLSPDTVLELSGGADFLVCSFDRALGSVPLWINRAALNIGVPALFSQIKGHKAIAGPLIIPEETACFMCWRMRNLACAEDFSEAMAIEEAQNANARAQSEREPVLPSLVSMLAGVLSTELLKTALAVGIPSLTGKVLELDALKMDMESHSVLQRPDCPDCGKKKDLVPNQPGLSVLITTTSQNGDPVASLEDLVSPLCGVVRSFKRLSKDQSEPEHPYIYRAELANSRFLEDADRENKFVVCSGKGTTLAQAQRSALGEAVERYSASLWGDERITRATRGELPDQSLDPQRLVLYRQEQYTDLPYVPYEEESILGWVKARSLVEDTEIYIPALAVFMAYEIRPQESYIFPMTSNGLAAGPSLDQAVLSGAMEVIERDAFLNLWLHSLPTQRVDPFSHPHQDITSLCRSYARRGVSMELYRVPMDHDVYVFVGLGVDEKADDSPAVVVGLGASYSPAAAARSAILEVAQVRPALRMRMRDPKIHARMEELLLHPQEVCDLTDHDLLYCHPKKLSSFNFMRNKEQMDFEWNSTESTTAAVQLNALVNQLHSQQSDLIYVNLTSKDMERLGLFCARIVIPDYQPIHFGRRERRLGGTRLFELPHRLGLRSDLVRLDELNNDPHPLA